MKTCAKCGAQNSDDTAFCSNCGYAFEQPGTYQGGAAPAPPPPPYGQPPAAYPPQVAPGAPYAPGQYPVIAQVNNSKATASLVLGIIAFVFCPLICSILALVLGYSARDEIAASGGRQAGESYAKAGIILGWIGIAWFVLWVIVVSVIVAVSVNATLMPLYLL
jgi:hypothetical protein